MMTIYRKENLPPDAKISEDLKQRAEFFMGVKFLGHPYYVPLTKEAKKIFQLHIKDGTLQISFGQNQKIEEFLRDLIASVYLQIRDTVGAEIFQKLNLEISETFSKMIQEQLSMKIENSFEQKQIKG
jgi:hypothetical protein